MGRGLPGRCGRCGHFPGNAKKCSENTRPYMTKVYANDYGRSHCDNYFEPND